MQIFSLRIEKQVLSGLIKYPDIYADIEKFVSEKDFFNDVHRTIYSVIKSTIDAGDRVDKVLIAEKIRNLGVSFKDEIDIYSYVDNLAFSQIKQKAVIDSAKELLKYRIRRELQETTQNVIKYIEASGNDAIDDIISNCDSLYNSQISSYSLDEEPIAIYETMEELIEERGNNPDKDSGFI